MDEAVGQPFQAVGNHKGLSTLRAVRLESLTYVVATDPPW